MPRHDPSEKTKSEILGTAARLFQERGWANVNIEDVVKEVGVTRGAFYHYFKSREDLIVAVVDKLFFDNNPFDIVAKETGLSGLEKLRLCLKMNLNDNAENVNIAHEMMKAMENPLIFKSEFLSQMNTVAPFIEKLLIEGNEDGSMSVQYPKETAQVLAVLPNQWLGASTFQMSQEELVQRFLFMEHLMERLGVPAVDDEIKELALKAYEKIKNSR